MIRYAQILNDSVVDGPGVRLVVFLQGCLWNCKGCHNPHLFPLNEGIGISEVQLAKNILKSLNPMHSGITFSGGDPVLQSESLLKVTDYIRSRKPDINIWLYTGFLFEDIKELPLLKNIDVIVDGPFEIEKKDISLSFKGSSNQRVIKVKETFENDKVTLLNK
jgi:anaerobic ribonucleoside-triphosphate reductase activating protein